jgi:hypothetical protein
MRHLLLIFLATALVVLANLASPQLARSQATFTIVNLDGPGEGFNDPTAAAPVGGNSGTTIGQQRLNAFQHAANIWGGLITSPVVIRVEAKFDPLSCTATSGVLGSAGPNTVHRDFAGAPVSNTWYVQAQANSLFGGDLNGATSDISATFSSTIGTPGCLETIGWYYGLDANPPSGKIDFVTVLLHELGHGLGFLSLVSISTGSKFLGFDDAFMRELEDHITGKSYPQMTDAERLAASINTGNLHQIGPNVVAGSGGLTSGRHPSGHVQMFAPNPAQSGSSVSHWDTALSPNELMEPSYTGPVHDVGLALDLLADLGWNVGLPLPSLSINDVMGNEGNSDTTSFNFTVTLSPTSNETVTVNFTTADGTATTAGSDYVAAFGNLTFNPGETTKTITVLVNGDTQIEPNETFFVNLTNATNAPISKSQGIGTIINDDTPPPLVIGASSLPDGEVGLAYNGDLQLGGGTPPYMVSISQGVLPAFLTVNSSGILSGSPAKASPKKIKSFTVKVTDSLGSSVSKQFKIKIFGAPGIKTKKLNRGAVGKSYSTGFTVTGGKSPYSNWFLVTGSLPIGLSPPNPFTGTIAGIPTVPGTFSLTIGVTDALGGVAQKNFTLAIK